MLYSLVKSAIRITAATTSIVLGVVGFYIGMSYFPVSTEKSDEIMDRTALSVVVVSNATRTHGGTGFILERSINERVLITNAHICAIAEDEQLMAFVDFNDTALSHLEVRYLDPRKDLCLMTSSYMPRGLKLRPYPPTLGEKIYAVGHPGLKPLEVAPGFVITPALILDTWAFITNAKIEPGSSGSPVVDGDGVLVGVVFAGDYFMNMIMVHYTELIRFLNDYDEFSRLNELLDELQQ